MKRRREGPVDRKGDGAGDNVAAVIFFNDAKTWAYSNDDEEELCLWQSITATLPRLALCTLSLWHSLSPPPKSSVNYTRSYLDFQIPFLLHTCLYFKKIYSLLIPLNMLPFSSPLFSSLLKIVHILTASNKHPSPLFYWNCSLESTKNKTAKNQAFSWSLCSPVLQSSSIDPLLCFIFYEHLPGWFPLGFPQPSLCLLSSKRQVFPKILFLTSPPLFSLVIPLAKIKPTPTNSYSFIEY